MPIMPVVLFTVAAALISTTPASASASLRVSNVFGSNMVLQRGRVNPVWGWGATPGQAVVVTFGSGSGPAGHVATAHATGGPDGMWKASLNMTGVEASLTGRELWVGTTANPEQIALTDVVVGDVLMCSGQVRAIILRH